MSRPRVAAFTPLPPAQSGIADYSRRLFAELGRTWELHAFSEDVPWRSPIASAATLRGVAGVHRASHFDWLQEFEEFDVRLFCLGNSGYHLQAWRQLLRDGGVVLAHDVWLAGLYFLRAQLRGDRHFLADTLRELYGPAHVHDVVLAERAGDDPAAMDARRTLLRRVNRFFARDVIRHSQRFLVHSHHAARVARLEAGDHADRVAVVPYGFPPAKARPPAPTRPVVSSFGIVAPEKHAPLIVEAAGHLRRLVPGVVVRFVGSCDPGYEAELRGFAARLGAADTVEFTGYVERDRYDVVAGETAVAIQLRAVFNGEASAAVTDCLASGLPTVVHDSGWFAELPRDVVAHVDPHAEPRAIAERLAALLDDAEARTALGERALQHAREHDFRRAAEAVGQHLVDHLAR